MVKKGNNPIPNSHLHKHWNPSAAQRGHVKTHFNQIKAHQRRRKARHQKAVKMFPKPLRDLKPIVQCPTQRYNMRARLGKGFTLLELKNAGLNKRFARSIGITVDHRRRNKSEERLELNTNRLKTYLSKLILYPLKHKMNPKGGRGAPKQTTLAEPSLKGVKRRKINAGPSVRCEVQKKPEPPRTLTEQEKHRHIYYFLRKVQRDKKLIGVRVKRLKKREEKAAKPDAAK
eukprot:NODE_6409_length_849_cov_434.604683_g6173_i0.p1 GENE.NODE_6409_length_849_cov_434.604683_g6173_i0~~NODE_6409_length_849_cov_434.604683_g6173_i0.p1  ORF type:complete len:250 (-),score=79.29 NODE_6409_length_849_cov_434.604683_g6173_i0:100-789(-)